MKKSILSTAIRSALGVAVTASAFPVGVLAQGEEDQIVEEVFVTGSRIRTTVAETPRPITTLDKADLQIKGITDVSRALREMTFNTLGSFRDQSGNSFGQIALVDLKGIGADRTAVLINGRRIGGNPLTGSAAVDLNTIPFSAVDRIEVLTDSASAVYGADAIGGVVNVIMKKEFTGVEISVGRDDPSRDNAYTDRFDATFGQASDKGSILFSIDYYKRNPVFDADRDYSRVSVTPGPNGQDPRHTIDTIGVSSGGNTGFSLDFSSAFRVGDCPTDLYIPISNPEGIVGAEGCGFGYADISMQTGGIERTSTFIDARYEVADDHQLYFENRVTKSDTFGRYAPAVGFFLVDAAAPLNPIGEDFFLFHRFVGHGNRDDNISITEMDNLVGMNGSIINDVLNYDVFVRNYKYDATSEGDTYVITSIIEDLVADGSYNFINPLDPDNAGAIQQSAATLLRDLTTEYTHAGVTLDGAFAELSGGAIGWAAGVEWAEEEYQDQYDNLREASNVLGSSGNSSAGDRERWAAFAEVELPVIDSLTFNVAVRYDDYNDFGSEFSPSISAKWDPLDLLGFRASWGEGFKAPNLGDLGQSLSQSFEDVTDFVRCEALGIPDDQCTSTQVEELTGGNPELNAETSESFNVGMLIKPLDGLELSVDYWSIEVEDAITTLDLTDVIELEGQGTLPDGVIVNRGPSSGGVPGTILRCAGGLVPPDCGIINVFGNLATFEVEGLDVRAQYSFDTGFGDFSATGTWSHYITYDEQPIPGGLVFERPGTADYPKNRFNGNIGWNYDAFAVSYTYQWVDSHEGGPAGEAYDAYYQNDINAIWTSDFGVDISFGIRNFTDEDPSVSKVNGWTASTSSTSTDLYDVAGRTYTLTATWRL